MIEIYRKRGRVVRWENGWLVRVVEHGEAIEDGATFRCHPLAHESENVDATEVERVAADAGAACGRPPLRVAIERLLISEGTAEHEFGDRRWSDVTRRIHIALVNDRLRALIDLASFDIHEIERVAIALARAGAERDAPKRLRLAPVVAAALLPVILSLRRISSDERDPSSSAQLRMTPTLVQVAQGVDGKGNPIGETVGGNWYRPSYRVRPVRMPMNLRARCDSTEIDRDLPIAIALLAPVEGLVLRVLIEDRETVYPATVRVGRIAAVASDLTFYPHGAGSFGAEMML